MSSIKLLLNTKQLTHYLDSRRLEPISRRRITIFQFCALPLQPPEKEEANVSYMHDNDESDYKGVGMPAVYPIATSTEPENEKREITVHDFIYKQAKDRIVDKLHLLYFYWDPHIIMTGMDF